VTLWCAFFDWDLNSLGSDSSEVFSIRDMRAGDVLLLRGSPPGPQFAQQNAVSVRCDECAESLISTCLLDRRQLQQCEREVESLP
jgi:hypothetical protein